MDDRKVLWVTDSKKAYEIRGIIKKLQAIKDFDDGYATNATNIDNEIAALGDGYVAHTTWSSAGVASGGTDATGGQLFFIAQ